MAALLFLEWVWLTQAKQVSTWLKAISIFKEKGCHSVELLSNSQIYLALYMTGAWMDFFLWDAVTSMAKSSPHCPVTGGEPRSSGGSGACADTALGMWAHRAMPRVHGVGEPYLGHRFRENPKWCARRNTTWVDEWDVQPQSSNPRGWKWEDLDRKCPIPGDSPGKPDLAVDFLIHCRGGWTRWPSEILSNSKDSMIPKRRTKSQKTTQCMGYWLSRTIGNPVPSKSMVVRNSLLTAIFLEIWCCS